MYSQRIIDLGKRFQGRLDPNILNGALDYVSFNEEGLAFELLCDHIHEYDVTLDAVEYSEIAEISALLGFSLQDSPYKHLQELVS
ncbi:MafI family immunity protein [Stenotrophomonas sp. PS02289]|uniref:MafI family immunity protein n=1 Tax=Stenotrophomonas sp. PS02289 TaxID=2991422 RepID=UPI002499DB05|nr:MafI family immunity protein [Stenotrophomonas sp. PS02289]